VTLTLGLRPVHTKMSRRAGRASARTWRDTFSNVPTVRSAKLNPIIWCINRQSAIMQHWAVVAVVVIGCSPAVGTNTLPSNTAVEERNEKGWREPPAPLVQRPPPRFVIGSALPSAPAPCVQPAYPAVLCAWMHVCGAALVSATVFPMTRSSCPPAPLTPPPLLFQS
jgi:hypothetical protein